MTPLTTFVIAFAAVRILAIAMIVASALSLAASQANAYSLQVKLACASDYYSHCSQHPVNSPGVTQCMNAVGPKLSRRCIKALIGDGYVSKPEADRRLANAH